MNNQVSKDHIQMTLAHACSTGAMLFSLTYIASHLLNSKQGESIANVHRSLVEEINKEDSSFGKLLAEDMPNWIGEEELEIVRKVHDMCFTVVADSVELAKDDDHSVYEVAKELGPTLFRIISSLNPNG